MNGMLALRKPSVGDARRASSHIRPPTRTRRSGSRSSSPCDSSSAISRDAVARCSRARRAICDTDSTRSSGVNASKMRTARDGTDSPVAVLAMRPKLPAGGPTEHRAGFPAECARVAA